ncbi:MAG TPA: hypothetical protein VFE05_20065 [Longimicrobiaceae bacterium]|nr:hypothetical protein [Longimicrobiaceae bacterium]
MRLFPALALLLCAAPAAAQTAVPADSYRDARAGELVRLARARRAVVDNRITAYHVTARERLSARLAVAGAERLLFRRETASHIDWSRDTVRVQVLGAREVAPPVSAAVKRASPDIAGSVPALAFDPVDSVMLLRVDSTVLQHPLAPGSEAYYRFSTGDSIAIRLPGGRTVRTVELRIAARRPDPHLINGSFWIDSDTHAVVRAAFRLSRGYSSRVSGLSVLSPEAGAELDYVVLDYGLIGLRWWLPRTIAARGVARFAGTRFPIEYERGYEGYTVEGDTTTTAAAALRKVAAAGSAPRPCRPRFFGSISIGTDTQGDSAWNAGWNEALERMEHGDTTRRYARRDSIMRARRGDKAGARPPAEKCDRVFVVTRDEHADLVAGPAFEGGIYDDGEGIVGGEELRSLTERLGSIPSVPWGMGRPTLQVLTPDLVRFNRVEGFSLGARAGLSFGPAALAAELRAGTTGEVGARLSGAYANAARRMEVAAYRGLQAVDPASQPFSLGTSASALLLGRDDNDYFRGTGAEVRLAPAAARRQLWDVRLFAERQSPVRARSNASLRGAFDDGFDVRPNLAADRIDQAGATLHLRGARGDDPARLRTHAELELHGETGDRSFGRPLLRLGADRLVGGGVGLAVGVSAGTAFGDVPAQRVWQIGGAGTVRGHDAAAMRGTSLWLARGELTRGVPLARLSLFGDAGWAGDRADVWKSHPLTGAGVGLAFLDNLVRIDVARGIGGGGGGTRVYLRMGGAL